MGLFSEPMQIHFRFFILCIRFESELLCLFVTFHLTDLLGFVNANEPPPFSLNFYSYSTNITFILENVLYTISVLDICRGRILLKNLLLSHRLFSNESSFFSFCYFYWFTHKISRFSLCNILEFHSFSCLISSQRFQLSLSNILIWHVTIFEKSLFPNTRAWNFEKQFPSQKMF